MRALCLEVHIHNCIYDDVYAYSAYICIGTCVYIEHVYTYMYMYIYMHTCICLGFHLYKCLLMSIGNVASSFVSMYPYLHLHILLAVYNCILDI